MLRSWWIIALLNLFAACSPAVEKSCAETCQGCCDATGTCQPGNAPAACGAQGFACNVCSNGSVCSIGNCVVPSTTGGGTAVGGGTAMGGGTATGGGTAMGGGTGTGGGSGASTCAGTLQACGSQCVDTLSSIEHCGLCNRVCGNGQVCIDGACALLPDDCSNASCGAGFYCDPVSRKCAPGCRLPTDCPAGGSCANNVCSCPSGQHACGQRCVSNAQVGSCGASCTACTAPANATPGCDGTSCTFTCNAGFTRQGNTCVDVDECAQSNVCGAGGTCTNSPGSYSCTCGMGYVASGSGCVDVDECATANGGCNSNATCTNTPGSRTCACNAGWSGDGMSCSDVNECTTANGGCSANAVCTNTPGSRTCACLPGYTGDGVTCTTGTAQAFAVVHLGAGPNGGAPTTAATEVHVEIRNATTGAVMQDLTLPTTATAGQAAFTLSGTATLEGMLNLSSNGTYLTLAGYDAPVGTPTLNTTAGINRVVARIALNTATIDTSTVLDGTIAYPAASVRSAATADGTGYWLAGASGGVRYAPHGGLNSSTQISTAYGNVRATEVVNGQLYASSTSPFDAGTPGADPSRIFAVGQGLPIVATSQITWLPGMNAASPTNFVLLDRSTAVPGLDTLYVCDTTSATTAALRFDFNGSTWAQAASFSIPSGSAYAVAAIPEAGQVRVFLSGSFGIRAYVDTGATGPQGMGSLLVTGTAQRPFRGIIALP